MHRQSRHPATCAAALLAIAAPLAAAQPLIESVKVRAPDGLAGSQFGFSVALDEGVLAVGAPYDTPNGVASGSAYLFDPSTGAFLFKLVADDPEEGAAFGHSIAMDGGVVAVGAPTLNAAYLFDGATGGLLRTLTPDDSDGGGFGSAIDVSGGLVVVGAHGQYFGFGAAYVFDAATGDQVSKLELSAGAAWDFFGKSVSIENGLVAVGAPSRSQTGRHSGAAYVFDARTGEQLWQLFPIQTNWYAQFGASICIDGGVVAAGADQQNAPDFSSGAAFLFDASTGSQLDYLEADDGAANDKLGTSISLSGGVVAVGAIGADDNGSSSGAAYVFDSRTGTQTAELLPSDGAPDDQFGHSIAARGGAVAVGAPRADLGGASNAGAVYLFSLGGCAPDLNQDGVVNTQDFLVFLNAWSSGQSLADWNGDGRIDTLDFLAFLNDWSAGC